MSDRDGDGVADADDCAPEDPSVHPGAEEECDGIDTDCVADPLDVDEDGDGVPLCADDCDDTDGSRFPGNEELCDGIDNDCAEGGLAGDEDADGDGILRCDGDCRDDRADVGPGQTEVCDGYDNDCNGTRDDLPIEPVPLEGEISLAESQTTLYGEFVDDMLGTFVAGPGDVNGDGYEDVLVGTDRCFSCGADVTIANRAYLLYGPICGEIMLGPTADGIVDAILWGEGRVSWVGDLDNDGYDDIGSGRSVIFGPITGEEGADWRIAMINWGPTWEGNQTRLRGLGDINGDGIDDLAVLGDRTGPIPDGYDYPAGEVSIFFGPMDALTYELIDADVRLHGHNVGGMGSEGFGRSVAAGDFTGDGVMDVAVGVDLKTGSLTGFTPYVYVFEGPLQGQQYAVDTTIRLAGEEDSIFGFNVASGDLNGDGIDDLAVYGDSEVHRVFMGPLAGVQQSTSNTLHVSGPEGSYPQAPMVFSDLDGDGVDDLVVKRFHFTGLDEVPEGWTKWDRLEFVSGSVTGSHGSGLLHGLGLELAPGNRIAGGDGEALSAIESDLAGQAGLIVGAPRGYSYPIIGRAFVVRFVAPATR